VNTILDESEIKLSFIKASLFNKYPRAMIKKTGITRLAVRIKFCKVENISDFFTLIYKIIEKEKEC
jgi:hypothetical protein